MSLPLDPNPIPGVRWLCWLLAALHLSCASARPILPAPPDVPALPPLSQQITLREDWLARRHALLLEMMRRHGVGMWIVMNQEFHEDPLTQYVAPPLPYAGFLDIFAFIDTGEQGLKKYALTQGDAHLARFFEPFDEKVFVMKALSELVARYQPRTIALNMKGTRGVTRGLTHDSYRWLVKALGPELEARFAAVQARTTELIGFLDNSGFMANAGNKKFVQAQNAAMSALGELRPLLLAA